MSVAEFAAVVVALAVVVGVAVLVTALNHLNATMSRLQVTADQLRDEGLAAFRELRQLVADADAELDKVDVVLDRADRATTAIHETSQRTYEAVSNPVVRTLAVTAATGRVAQGLRRSRRSSRPQPGPAGLPPPGHSPIDPPADPASRSGP
jgi:uncharacterized protein YoxC